MVMDGKLGEKIKKGVLRVLKHCSAVYEEKPSKKGNIPSQDTPVSHLRFFPCHEYAVLIVNVNPHGLLQQDLDSCRRCFKFSKIFVRMALRHILSSPPCFLSSR
jgi:hypothetical protein